VISPLTQNTLQTQKAVECASLAGPNLADARKLKEAGISKIINFTRLDKQIEMLETQIKENLALSDKYQLLSEYSNDLQRAWLDALQLKFEILHLSEIGVENLHSQM
jgi:hypothetical protein